MATCEVCGAELRKPRRGSVGRYCGVACRVAGHRARAGSPIKLTPEQLRIRRAEQRDRRAS